MSIFKDQQRDDGASWWRRLVSRLTGAKCVSWIKYPCFNFEQVQFCIYLDGHEGKHESVSGLKWGYGDNWLDNEPHPLWMKK